MADEKLEVTAPLSQKVDDEYQTPKIEEVMTRENLEREAAYAGNNVPSRLV
jgi:hypothetical protein